MLDVIPVYLHPHEAATEPVTLHEGRVVLRAAANETVGRGRLVLRFLPSTGVRLEADIISGAVPDAGDRALAEIAGGFIDTLVNSVRHSMMEGITSARIEASVSRFEVGGASELAAVGFQILNFPDFLTPGPKLAPVFGFPPMVADLFAGGWRARLTAVERSSPGFPISLWYRTRWTTRSA